MVFSASTETDCQRSWRSAYQWWFLSEGQFIFSNWYKFLTCKAEYVQGISFITGFCWWQGDWEGSRVFLAEMRLHCSGMQTNPFALWQARLAEAPASLGLCGPNWVCSAGLFRFTVLDLWLIVSRDCLAALKRLVPLSLGTADPACQLWDKLDDLARLPYPVLCGSLILSWSLF